MLLVGDLIRIPMSVGTTGRHPTKGVPWKTIHREQAVLVGHPKKKKGKKNMKGNIAIDRAPKF